MQDRAKGPRLYLRPASGTRKSSWVIRDGAKFVSTGCAPEDREGAERKLAAFLTEKHEPSRDRDRRPSEIDIADVIAIYLAEKVGKVARPHELKQRVVALATFFGGMMLSEMSGELCRAYVRHRKSTSAARRELEDLRAAITFHRKEGFCSHLISVVMPEKSQARERWMTRDEAARLLWIAMGWRLKAGQDRNGRPALVLAERDRQNTMKRRHLARFILVGLYTGTRATAICQAAMRPTVGRGHVDLERGVFYRRAAKTRETKKRQPPVRIHPRLLAHLRRWDRIGASTAAIVEWKGEPIARMNKAFRNAAAAAQLDDVTPHILRHTAITWAMQGGADRWEVAGMFGVTMEIIERVYGHHREDQGASVHAAISGRRRA